MSSKMPDSRAASPAPEEIWQITFYCPLGHTFDHHIRASQVGTYGTARCPEHGRESKIQESKPRGYKSAIDINR